MGESLDQGFLSQTKWQTLITLLNYQEVIIAQKCTGIYLSVFSKWDRCTYSTGWRATPMLPTPHKVMRSSSLCNTMGGRARWWFSLRLRTHPKNKTFKFYYLWSCWGLKDKNHRWSRTFKESSILYCLVYVGKEPGTVFLIWPTSLHWDLRVRCGQHCPDARAFKKDLRFRFIAVSAGKLTT